MIGKIEKIGKIIKKLEVKIGKLEEKADKLEDKYKGKVIKAEIERRKKALALKASNLRTKIKRLERVRLYFEKKMKEREEKGRKKK
ncbi:MAG: hypothetical protein QMD21_01345 [Candidatus Thermoplasmatota archaeon]|nr:hypothetical protein [Candidatus Thermoplasmatota archaeon]